MGASLIIALGAAGLGLLIFGERLGLPASWAASGVIGIFAFQIAGLALASTTSRLHLYLRGSGEDGIWHAACTVAGPLILVGIIDPGLARFESARIAAFLSAFVPVLLLMPAPGSDLKVGQIDARRMLAIVTALSALIVAFMAWGPVKGAIIIATGWPDNTAEFALLAGAGFPAVLGGLSGVLRIIGVFTLMLALLCFIPVGFEFVQAMLPIASVEGLVGSFLAASFLADSLQQISDTAWAGISGLVYITRPSFNYAGMILLGFLAALTTQIAGPALPRAASRGIALLLGIALALGFTGAFFIGREHLDGTILPVLARVSPEAWPLFVFEPALEGWLTVCGRAPQDGVDVAQACGTAGPPPLTRLAIHPQLAFPALAASANWPLLLGVIWSLAVPLLAVLALGGLVHMAASGLSEHLVHHFLHPRALRAWRLAISRLVALGILGVVGMSRIPATLADERLLHVLIGGLVILFAASLVSIGLRMIFAALAAKYRKDRDVYSATALAAE